jgi:hypothetical protein
MSLTKAALVAMGMIGSMAVGVLIAPYVTERTPRASTPVAVAAEPFKVADAPVGMQPSRPPSATMIRIAAVATDAPALQARIKPALARGTNVQMAAAGFGSAEQFATVAHLSRNTGIPFVLLKHRVLNEGRTMTAAVKMSRPDVNAELEVNRARAEARSDIWAVG